MSTSAIWFDYDRDGFLDLLVCNYVRWSAESDVFCSLDGKNKSYCTPEAYRGDTCWLYHNRGNGTFEDVTATSGIFDSSSKSLGVAMLDYDQDGWPDILVANDTQPNKLYRNLRNGKFKDVAVEAGLAFSAEGKARAGMGVDVADFDNSGRPGIVITNFDNEMIGLYRTGEKATMTSPCKRDSATLRETPWALAACSSTPISMACWMSPWPTATSTKPSETFAVMSAMPNRRNFSRIWVAVNFATSPRKSAADFDLPKVGRGLAVGDFDRDGDFDVLLTTNNGPRLSLSQRSVGDKHSIRFRLIGTKSNRDAIGATVKVSFTMAKRKCASFAAVPVIFRSRNCL